MAARKKRNAAESKRKRSAAAKKGWETRRKWAGIHQPKAFVAPKTPKPSKVVDPKKSVASRKGWETRRRRKAQELENADKRIKNAKKGVSKKDAKKIEKELGVIPELGRKPTYKELQYQLRLKNAEIEMLQQTKGWVMAMPDEYIRQDGTVAIMPSRARHMGNNTVWALNALTIAYNKSEEFFNQTVRYVAGKLDVPIREIYTLWFSP